MSETILLLHPGEMGSSIGAALRSNDHSVLWVSEGRSEATVKRADAAGLQAVASLEAGVAAAQHVVSVCPPDAAQAVATTVAELGFAGTYVDANAVAPATAREVAAAIGANYVDGGIVGPPAWREGATRLYLSGDGAKRVAGWFASTLVDARAIEGGAGAASALKMCYAAYTKGTSALLLAIRALAEHEGVTESLLDEWDISQGNLRARSESTAASTSPKAWRFEGEMREIAATFEKAELPGGFHQAAAEVYQRMSGLKHADHSVSIDEVIAELTK